MADDFGNGDAMDLPVGAAAVNRLIEENSHIFSDKHCKVCSAVLISESQKLAHYQSKKHANKYRRYKTIHQEEDISPAKKMKVDDIPQQKVTDDGDRNKFCPICNMTFSSPVVALSHYDGRTHSKNVKLMEQGGAPQGVPRVTKPAAAAPARLLPANTDKSDPQKFCQLCSATFNNPHMAEQHYKGRKHKKQETKSELMTIYTSSGNKLPQTTPLNPLTPGSGATGNWYNCDTCNIVLNSIEQYQAHISGSKHKNNLEGIAPTPYWDRPKPTDDRRSFGSFLSSSRLLPSKASSTMSGFSSYSDGLSSSFGYSSMTGNYSSSYGLSNSRSTTSSEGLLPLPSYPPENEQYFSKDMMSPDSYNYYNQGY
ncbi:hypothetical protein GDO78_006124 [Eleutherodactylus coqui]|uniref:Zinc finger protein 346 n=1 Tax=Eleutherodactylus coqui TaxID=57060 RepID=A0A8J6FMQ9_ELECQ|nr:hypothetical protein GDO78_006124 [Eleutherodactylus coqui]